MLTPIDISTGHEDMCHAIERAYDYGTIVVEKGETDTSRYTPEFLVKTLNIQNTDEHDANIISECFKHGVLKETIKK